MKVKRITALLITVFIMMMVIPLPVKADTVYTVTLDPGEGTGEPITYSSAYQDSFLDWRSAGNLQFYRENDGRMGFKLDSNYCPDSFSAPEGYEFDGWDLRGVFTLSSQATTCTAKWRVAAKAKITLTPAITLTPNDFDEDGYALVTIEITELDFGPNAGLHPYIDITFLSNEFSDENGSDGLSFEPYSTDHENYSRRIHITPIKEPGSYSLLLHIDPEDLAAKAPGTYTCLWDYYINWFEIGEIDAPTEGILELTLTIPEDSVIPGSGTGEGGLVHRMYNPNSGEHFYTVSDEERDNLISLGWNYESECSFTAPAPSDDTLPVYRLYNPSGDEHRFTTDTTEVETLYNDFGWNYEGISFCVYRNDSGNGVPVYRALNPNNGYYNFTTGKYEQDYIVGLGWVDEGVVWRVEK